MKDLNKEDKEITKFISRYRDFLVNNHIDVAQSIIENNWFVYRYQERYGYYEFFTSFSTVSELVDIILDEIRFELYTAIEREIAPPDRVDSDLPDVIRGYYQDEDGITEFTVLLDMIVNSELGKDSKFFEKLNKLWRTREDIKNGKVNL